MREIALQLEVVLNNPLERSVAAGERRGERHPNVHAVRAPFPLAASSLAQQASLSPL